MMVQALFLGKTSAPFVQFFRYTLVGALAFLVDFACLFWLTEMVGLHYLLSAALSFVGGLMTNYTLANRWVFQQRTAINGSVHFACFALIGLLGLGLNELLMWLLTEYLFLHYLLSKAGATGVVYLWNFLARKYTLYR
jgi:putative flippase GtrA